MTLAEICEAAMIVSDNTAGNLILAALGGPAGFTAYVRSLGDSITRLDRIEPDLNEAAPGDPRDTTTPLAMLGNVQKLVLGDALSAASREQLTKWMLGNKTGDTRLRAQLPAGWRTGDKTGAGERGTNNDVGVLWPPGRQADRGCGLSHRNVGAGRQAECHAGCGRPRHRHRRSKTRRDVLAEHDCPATFGGNLPYPRRHVPCQSPPEQRRAAGTEPMRILVTYAHPVETSFHAAMHARAVTALRSAGHEVDDCDLYAEGFKI